MICPRCNNSNTAAQLFCGQCGAPLSTTSTGYDTKDRLGTVLDGRYLLRSLIGIGSAGAVYKAEKVGLGTTVAVKVLHPHVSADQSARLRLENEAKLASGIDHPNIVAILDLHSTPDLTYLVMEYLSGVSLDEVLAEVGHLGLRRTIHIVRQLLSALEASHRLGVLHRDLKPDNIYLTARQDRLDFVKVVDFGLATLRHQGDQSRITVEGHVCGTPGYMAPEQARNQELTEESDLYAVGVILYECLTGNNPFLGQSTVDTMVNQITLTPRVPSKVNRAAQIPLYVDALVMRALSKHPEDRFASAREFRTVLEGLVLAQKRRGDTAVRATRTCAECGFTLQEEQTHCSACGEPAAKRFDLTPTGMNQVLTPEMISALDSSEVPATELDLSPTTAIRAYSSVRWDPPYVGRKEELAAIDGMLERPHPPCDQRFLRILGGAGLGKGRLAREAARRAGAQGWSVVWVQPELHPAFAALYPIQRAVAKLLRVPAFPPDKSELLAAADKLAFAAEHQLGLQELFGLTAPSRDPAKQRRRRRAEALREAVRCAATRKPLLLLFQDLHIFDAPSQELVASLATKHSVDNPASVIVTHDPTLMLLWPQTETMTVQSLSSEEAQQLARTLLEHIKLKVDGIEEIISASRGSPMMLIELVRLATIDPSIKPPRSLAEVINKRISLLPPKMRTMLHTMAVLGRPTNPDTLVTVLEEDLEAEHRGLNFLAEQGFLLNVGSGWHHAHRLHQQVAYGSVPAALRLQLHAKAADMAIVEAEPSATVAYHLYEAGEHEQAVPHLLRAGRRALYFLDDQLAARLFDRVLRLVPSPPGVFRDERGPWTEATLGLASAMHDGGDDTPAFKLLKQAVTLAEQVGWEREHRELDRTFKKMKRESAQP